MTWALALTFRSATSTPRARSPSSSRNSASGETTTPLAITEVAPGVRMPLGSRWVAYFSPSITMVWPALWPPLVRTTKSMGSVVASRSVALPLPSSPHWAPSTTIAGISALLASKAGKETAPAQGTGALAASRYRTSIRSPHGWNGRGTPVGYCPDVRSLLVITNADAGTSDEETLATALEILRADASVEVAKTSNPGELDGVLHRAGGRTVIVAGGDGSIHAVVTALHKRRELEETTLALLPMGTGNDFARGNDIPLDVEEAARLVLAGQPRPVDLIVDE